MKVSLRQIYGPWDAGWVLDKHTLKSTYTGDGPSGRPTFKTERTEVGEATYQLKYGHQQGKAALLARAMADEICPKLDKIGFIVPMPASTQRAVQPVNILATELAKILNVPVFEAMLKKADHGKKLKDLSSKEEKLAVLNGSIALSHEIENEGVWNALLLDDLFDSGASMETACNALRTYRKIGKIYVAALTWK